MIESIPLPSGITFLEDKKDPKRVGQVIIEPCFPGYGETIGNSLRRVLLSSLPGFAVHAIKIDGVDHEFSTMKGVKEDVIEIMLNVKKLRFLVHSDEPVKLEIDVKGEHVVTAGDIKKADNVEVVNPDQVIATLTSKDARFKMELWVDQGRGYVPVEQRETKKMEVGIIAVDSIYTPVKKVNFQVENMRVGKMTNFDKITMTIETDGTIAPAEALKKSAKVLFDHYALLQGDLSEAGSADAVDMGADESSDEEPAGETMDKEIGDMKLSTRTFNALQKADLMKASLIAEKTEEELLGLEGFGKSALVEVKKKLKKLGLALKG